MDADQAGESEKSKRKFCDLSFFHLGVIISRHTLLLGFRLDPRNFSMFLDHVFLRGQEWGIGLFVKIFVSERRDFHVRGYHCLAAICHGERSFPSGCSGGGAITPKDYTQLRGPSSFECVEASLQGPFDDLVDSLNLAIAL